MLPATQAVVAAAWVAMLAILAARHQRLHAPEATRVHSSRLGLLLQLVAYVLVFAWRPSVPTVLSRWSAPGLFDPAAMIAAASAAAVVVWCQRTLGVQWSLTARLIEGHRLVTTGPYAYVRNPIYAAMLPMLAATSVAFSTPAALVVASIAYLLGTRVRIASEERLMMSAFGEDWTAYSARVPALCPWPRGARPATTSA